MKHHTYHVYILLCSDGSYYTGVTNDIDRRFEEHQNGSDPYCYTYSRRPLVLKFSEPYQFVDDAIGREKQIKGWSRRKKEALISSNYEKLKTLSMNRVRREEKERSGA